MHTQDKRGPRMSPPRRGVRFSQSTTTPPKFPSGGERVLHSIFSPSYHSNKSSSSESPSSCNQAPISKVTNNKNNMSPISVMTEGSLYHQQQPRRTKSNNNNKSFDTLQSVEMLNFEYIQNCESENELQHIIYLLRKKESRLLLQEAQERLASVQVHFLPQNISRISLREEEEEGTKSATLDFSLSPGSTKLHGADFIDTSSNNLAGRRVAQDFKEKQHSKHQALVDDLEKQKLHLEQQNKRSKQMEISLQSKIQNLLTEVKKARDHARLVKTAEKGLREQKEQDLQQEQVKTKSLNGQLKEAHGHLERMKRRQAKFRLEIFRSMGMTMEEWRSMSQGDLLGELTNRIRSMKEQNKVAKSKNTEKLVQENLRLDGRLQESLQEKSLLERENLLLSQKIQDLAQEVASSRAYIDKLLQTADYFTEEKEQKYQKVVANLRQQIRKQTSAVSIDLYKAAVDNGNHASQELKEAQDKIASLVEKLKALEQKPSSSPSKQRLRQVATSPSEYLKEKQISFLGKPELLKNNKPTLPVVNNFTRPQPTLPFVEKKLADIAKTPNQKLTKSSNQTNNDLIGLEVLVPSPEAKQQAPTSNKPRMSPLILRRRERRNQKLSTNITHSKNKEAIHPTGTENVKPPSATPLRKARQAGGRKALAEKIKKMRSPPRHHPLKSLSVQ